MFCLETTFLIDLLKGEERAMEFYRKLRDSKICTTSISAWEILRGPRLIGKKDEFEATLEMLENIDILPFSFNSAKIVSEVESSLKKKGLEVNLVDVLIASIVIEHDLKLVTRDKHLSRIEGLEVFTY